MHSLPISICLQEKFNNWTSHKMKQIPSSKSRTSHECIRGDERRRLRGKNMSFLQWSCESKERSTLLRNEYALSLIPTTPSPTPPHSWRAAIKLQEANCRQVCPSKWWEWRGRGTKEATDKCEMCPERSGCYVMKPLQVLAETRERETWFKHMSSENVRTKQPLSGWCSTPLKQQLITNRPTSTPQHTSARVKAELPVSLLQQQICSCFTPSCSWSQLFLNTTAVSRVSALI